MATGRVNYDKLSDQQKINLLTKNQVAAAEKSAARAATAAQSIQSIGAAAAMGGQFADVRPGLSGSQNIETAQYTNLLKNMITRPITARQRAMIALRKARKDPSYQKALTDTSGGSGIYRAVAPTGAVPSTQQVL
jgi:hypothetical protein